MITLRLSERQASYLMDIIDEWQAEHNEVLEDVELTEPFDTPEDMLDAVTNIHIMMRDTASLREDLLIALRKRGVL